MTKRLKNSLTFLTETEENITLKLKIFFSVFEKLKSVKNTGKKTEKKIFFQGFMPDEALSKVCTQTYLYKV